LVGKIEFLQGNRSKSLLIEIRKLDSYLCMRVLQEYFPSPRY